MKLDVDLKQKQQTPKAQRQTEKYGQNSVGVPSQNAWTIQQYMNEGTRLKGAKPPIPRRDAILRPPDTHCPE